jgi:hypothetical protein
MEAERESTTSRSLENPLWRRLWTCCYKRLHDDDDDDDDDGGGGGGDPSWTHFFYFEEKGIGSSEALNITRRYTRSLVTLAYTILRTEIHTKFHITVINIAQPWL